MAVQGYGTGELAPGVIGSGVNDYIVAKNLLLAHSEVQKLYKTVYSNQTGK